MVESALNVAAEQVVEWSAYGNLMQRDGNRSPLAAPQGLYPCAGGEPGAEKWLALSVATDAQWRALCGALGNPEWALAPALATRDGRREAHDAIDERLREWARERERGDIVSELRSLEHRALAPDPCADHGPAQRARSVRAPRPLARGASRARGRGRDRDPSRGSVSQLDR